MGVLVGSYTQSADHIRVESDYEKSRWEDVFIMFFFCFFSPPSCSLHSPLSKVLDLEGRGGLDLPHPAGSRHGPGQLGGGLLHRHLPARWVIEEGQKGRRNKVLFWDSAGHNTVQLPEFLIHHPRQPQSTVGPSVCLKGGKGKSHF